MSKKLLQSSIFVLLFIAVFMYFNNQYINTAYYQSIDGIYNYKNIQYDLEIVNVGSSHGLYGIDYTNYSDEYRCFNFAFTSQMPTLDIKMLESYKEHLANECIVIIPVSYPSFYFNFDQYYNDQKSRYYQVLKLGSIPDINAFDLIDYRYFPLLSAGKNIYEITKPKTEPSYAVPDGTIVSSQLVSAGKRRAQAHLNIINKHSGDLSLSNYNVSAFYEMLDFCKENNFRPVIITTPVTEYYDKHFSDSFKKSFYDNITSILSNYPDVVYLDYSTHEQFYRHAENFVDTDHLNKKGRLLFTDILMRDLRTIFGSI